MMSAIDGATGSTDLETRTVVVPPTNTNSRDNIFLDGSLSLSSSREDLVSTGISTPITSISSCDEMGHGAADVHHYIALGCLHFDPGISIPTGPRLDGEWLELIPELPDETKAVIGAEVSRLLDARWIRMFVHQAASGRPKSTHNTVRVYLLPEDWSRRSIDRSSRSLKVALRLLLQQIDTSSQSWSGNNAEGNTVPFDTWAAAEPISLYYLFNKLPSPAPKPQTIKSRYARAAAHDLLRSAAFSEWEEHGEQPLAGLKTRLYPYQARSAALMMQRESEPQLQLDPRLEVRISPNGKKFFFAPRDGSFLQEPVYYEANRGGILAETMGLGKTLICLALILATRGHLPQVPAAYQQSALIRDRVGSLSDMAAATMGRNAIPARAYIEQSEANGAGDLSRLRLIIDRNMSYYEIPPDLPRINRTTKIPPPRQLVVCSGTIIVVPRNLLHQWQSEIRKHVLTDGLKILVVDSVPKRGAKSKVPASNDETMHFVSELPAPTRLMTFDVVLFTRNRFEMEIQDGQDENGRRAVSGVTRTCSCPYIGATRLPDCNCLDSSKFYESPLKKLHWLRIIIDEGHSFSSAISNAVLVAKQIQAERRWVVSGTPAKNLVGVEVDISTLDTNGGDAASLRDSTLEQRKSFVLDNENTKAVKALGLLASNFLMVRPWCDGGSDGRLEWDEYVYRHEHQHKRTYTAFSSCFLRTLEGLVVKTRPEDVERDIVLPPMRHHVVYLQPCWFDKMTANLFVQVLRANAITSERSDVDYLFHKNNVKARHSLIKNLRQSNFAWTGFSIDNVISTVETSNKYLLKEGRSCTSADEESLLESTQIVSSLTRSEAWIALSKAREVGMAITDWPKESLEAFALTKSVNPTLVGVTQLIYGQLHVDSHILSSDPAAGLDGVGRAAYARVLALAETDGIMQAEKEGLSTENLQTKTGVPASCVNGQQLRRPSITMSKSPHKQNPADAGNRPQELNAVSPVRPKKRKLTLADETAMLAETSSLRNTRIVGTTSAKLTYLLDKVVQHQAKEKIIIFYDGDDAAFYIAQCLELLYVNHRIYARTLDNVKRSEYVRLFNEDPEVRVLLIDVACGALGLNLNAASVVLIVNPINRPFLEAQAVKRAHRIGQTKEVLVETLVLENTIEHAIFSRAKKMTHSDHQEAKELEDDADILHIIQNAKVLPVTPEEETGLANFALLKTPQQIFGRPDRHKYHRYGFVQPEPSDKPPKKAKSAKSLNESGATKKSKVTALASISAPRTPSSTTLFDGQASESHSRSEVATPSAPGPSIFGGD